MQASPSFKSWDRVKPNSARMEILALRHQLGVLQRSVKRPKMTAADRRPARLSQVWNDSRYTLIMVRPETVIAWHWKDFLKMPSLSNSPWILWPQIGNCERHRLT